MIRTKNKITFEVLIDDLFTNINTDPSLTTIQNKKVLSLINDFEDGKWRYKKFENFIWDNITETALTYKERQALIGKSHTSLTEAAQNLRLTDSEDDGKGQGSELAEIILYGIMKHHFGALPVVPKIYYKQNSQDNAKGADSVHIIIEEDEDFSLWFGEAKFYNSIEDARLGSIVTSVENSLKTDKLKKENGIITNLTDIRFCVKNKKLRNKIIKMLSTRESIDLLKPKLNIPILLLHECKITKDCSDLTDDYKTQIKDFHLKRAESYFKKQIDKLSSLNKYSEIKFHIILFPVPIKKTIVDKFVSNVTFYKDK